AAGRPEYVVLARSGRNPLERQAPAHLTGHELERARRIPHRAENSYPHAFETIAQFFDSPHAPDLLAVHTAPHHTDGYLGPPGCPGVVQARARRSAACAAVRSLGVVGRSPLLFDIAPPSAAPLGLGPPPAGGGPTGEPDASALQRRQDGGPELELLDGSTA